MVCLVTVEFACKEGLGEQTLEDLRAMMPDTRKRDGLVDIVVHVDQDTPNRIFLVEYWENRAAHEAYLAWRFETSDHEKMGKTLAGPPKIGYWDITDA